MMTNRQVNAAVKRALEYAGYPAQVRTSRSGWLKVNLGDPRGRFGEHHAERPYDCAGNCDACRAEREWLERADTIAHEVAGEHVGVYFSDDYADSRPRAQISVSPQNAWCRKCNASYHPADGHTHA